jgi:hypothetical protein
MNCRSVIKRLALQITAQRSAVNVTVVIRTCSAKATVLRSSSASLQLIRAVLAGRLR